MLQLGPVTARRNRNVGGVAGLGQAHVGDAQAKSDRADRLSPDAIVELLAGEDMLVTAASLDQSGAGLEAGRDLATAK